MHCLWTYWHFKPTVVSLTHPFKWWHTPDGSRTLPILLFLPQHEGRSRPAVSSSPSTICLFFSAYLSQNERESSKGQEILSHWKRYLKIVESSSCCWNTAAQPAAWVVEAVVGGYRGKASLHHSKYDRHMHGLASLSLKAPRCRVSSQQPSSPPCSARFCSHFAFTPSSPFPHSFHNPSITRQISVSILSSVNISTEMRDSSSVR